MLNFDESFFVGLSVTIFIAIMIAPVRKILKKFIANYTDEVKNKLEQAERLKKEAEELLTTYLTKQQQIQEEINRLTQNAESEIKAIYDNADKQLAATLKYKSEQAMQRISQYESAILDEVRSQAIEIAFIAVKTIIRERMSIQDSERLISTVIEDLDNRIN